MKSLLEKLKNLLQGVDKKIVLIVCLVIVVVVLAWTSWWKPKPVDTTQLLTELQTRLTKQFEINIKDRDAKIKDLSSRLVVSDSKYKVLQKRLTEVRNEIIIPPKTNRELRDRFTSLGFAPR